MGLVCKILLLNITKEGRKELMGQTKRRRVGRSSSPWEDGSIKLEKRTRVFCFLLPSSRFLSTNPKRRQIFWIQMATTNGAKKSQSSKMGPKVLFYSLLLTLQYGAQPLISKRCIGYSTQPLNLSSLVIIRLPYSVISCVRFWKEKKIR